MNRVRFRDIKPYAVVDDLDELQGPRTGVIELPHRVFWQHDTRFDLTTFGGARTAYQELLAEGQKKDLVQFLNRELLVRIWPQLRLDPRVRELWESRFPELVSVVVF